MIYFISLALGLIIGKMIGGKFSNLLNVRLRNIWIVLSAFLLQTALRFIYRNGSLDSNFIFLFLNFVIYVMLGLGFWFNRHYLGMCIMGIGMMLNAIVILSNGGKMPVDAYLLEGHVPGEIMEVLASGMDPAHSLITDTTNIAFLADIIKPPPVLRYLNLVVSIGDLFIALGILVLIVELLRGRFKFVFWGNFKSEVRKV